MRWVSPTRKRVFLLGLDNVAAEFNRWIMPGLGVINYNAR